MASVYLSKNTNKNLFMFQNLQTVHYNIFRISSMISLDPNKYVVVGYNKLYLYNNFKLAKLLHCILQIRVWNKIMILEDLKLKTSFHNFKSLPSGNRVLFNYFVSFVVIFYLCQKTMYCTYFIDIKYLLFFK